MIFSGHLLLIVIVLGFVEGLTEFLPISSSYHVMFVGDLLGLGNDSKIKFLLNVILQMGAIFALVVVFRKDFFILWDNMIRSGDSLWFNGSCLCFGHIVLGTLPALILGLVFYEDIKNIFQIRYMFYALIVGGILLLISDIFSNRFHVLNVVSKVSDITYLQAFFVGCFQCLSLCPGFSRSGATMSGGLLVGMSRYVSSMFSFLLSIPIMFGASVLSLYRNVHTIVSDDLLLLVVGFFVSFVVSLLTIKVFIGIVQRISFIVFAIYRFIMAFFLYVFDFV